MVTMARRIMQEAIESIVAIHQPTDAPAEEYDVEEAVEKLDLTVITACQALFGANFPDQLLN